VKILLDENFPSSAVDVIEESGHEAVSFSSACAFGDDDETVFSKAQEIGAVILTSDRDFYHTIPLIHPHHHGIVVVALRQPNRAAILARLSWFFERFDEPLADKVFILRDFSCRVK